MESLMRTIKEKITHALFPKSQPIDQIIMQASLVNDIIRFARTNQGKEFSALLEGKITGGTLTVTHLVYQPFHSSRTAAFMWVNLPMTSHTVGSVHSHPTNNNTPSGTDLKFWQKRGLVHIIIGYPYTESSITLYDPGGNRLPYQVSA